MTSASPVPTAVVTGATGGIGEHLVYRLIARGYRVLAVGRSEERLAEVVDLAGGAAASQPGGDGPPRGARGADPATGTVVPVIWDQAAKRDVPEPLRSLPEVDVLVHNAAVGDVVAVADTTPESWTEVWEVNVASAGRLTAALLPALRLGAGHVILVNAAPGVTGVPKWSGYVATKAALREFADSLRAEESASGVRVTSVFPPATATDLLERVRTAFGRDYDPATLVAPSSAAAMILSVLDHPRDAYAVELLIGGTGVR